MQQPQWDDPDAGGTMVRGALWLLQVIGEGNTYTKGQIREAFPEVSQADRRIRDLRRYGWVLHSSNEDASLLAEDQRFVKAGVPVWDPEARRAHAPQSPITAKERRAALARDDYMCTLCGIAGGEPYPDEPLANAVLAVSRVRAIDDSGRERQVLVTECKRCRSGSLGAATMDVRGAVAAASVLEPEDLSRLQRWMERGRRGATDLDRAWAAFLRVPVEDRDAVLGKLRRG